jgi:hypothetical protein
MTAKENVLSAYPSARLAFFPRVANNAKPDEICYSVIVVYQPKFGAPFDKTIGTAANIELAWEEAWQHIQQEMIIKLETPTMSWQDQFAEHLGNEIRKEIDMEIFDLLTKIGITRNDR